MTFKNLKFEESEVMRSFQKLAIKKGLIKIDPIKKEASKILDLTHTNNFVENLMKLCKGLREVGMGKYATELESNFILLKQSENLYETSKEKGEDLVDEAHPKGSYKLEGLEGDSIIETIIDQQSKDLDVLKKKPTGKLSTSSEIIEEAIKALS